MIPFPVLDKVANMLTEHPEVSIQVHGHTDSDGTNESNQTLSENRANSVVSYLVEKGVASNRLSIMGHGEDKPIDNSGTDTAKAKNRRVEFVLNK